MKTPTPEQKIEMYENFLHKLCVAATCVDNDLIARLIQRADNWSYAHRRGNGYPSDEEQQAMIDAAFWKLLD